MTQQEQDGLGASAADAADRVTDAPHSASLRESSPSGSVPTGAAGQWTAVADALPAEQGQPLLVTNNPNARNSFGHLSHAWCVNGIYKDTDGDFCAFDGNLKIWGVSHWAPVFPPASAAGARSDETAQQAQPEGRQSGGEAATPNIGADQ